MQSLEITGIVVMALTVLYSLDRLLLWGEARGWIYWRKRRASAVTARTAALHVQSLIEPGKAYQIEEERAEREEEDGEGAPEGKGRHP